MDNRSENNCLRCPETWVYLEYAAVILQKDVHGITTKLEN